MEVSSPSLLLHQAYDRRVPTQQAQLYDILICW
jgi:hypothetical protein